MSISPYMSIHELSKGIRNREFLPTELNAMFLDRISKHNQQLHSYINVAEELIKEESKQWDAVAARDTDAGPLSGLLIPIKDCYDVKGLPTTFNSPIFENYNPESDDLFVARLRKAGALPLGKLNLNQFFSIPSDADLIPPPRNPWNTEYVTIGTSSGAGTAVAAGLCVAALGGDGGGSARLPAGQCNLIGLKPTHRLIPRKECSRIGDIGILSRTVTDCALLLEALASYESDDPRFADGRVPPYSLHVSKDPDARKLRIAVPWTYIRSIPLEEEVEASFQEAVKVMASAGFTVSDVEIPELEVYRAANFIVLAAESYTKHMENLKKNWSKYTENARLNAVKGSFLSACDYIQALEVGRAARERISGILKQHSLIALPTSPVVTSEAARRNPQSHSVGLNASYTAPFNLSGHPAISLPCGMSSVGLPMGFQLIADFYQEGFLLNASRLYEESTRWHTMHPPEFS